MNNKFFLFLENGLVDVLSNSEVRSFYVMKLLCTQQSAVILVIFYQKVLSTKPKSMLNVATNYANDLERKELVFT